MRGFVLCWQLDSDKVPFTLQRCTRSLLMAQVKRGIKNSIDQEWGSFVSSTQGYVVAEGGETEAKEIVERFAPFVSFEIHPIASAC
jgi:hypothetical protein